MQSPEPSRGDAPFIWNDCTDLKPAPWSHYTYPNIPKVCDQEIEIKLKKKKGAFLFEYNTIGFELVSLGEHNYQLKWLYQTNTTEPQILLIHVGHTTHQWILNTDIYTFNCIHKKCILSLITIPILEHPFVQHSNLANVLNTLLPNHVGYYLYLQKLPYNNFHLKTYAAVLYHPKYNRFRCVHPSCKHLEFTSFKAWMQHYSTLIIPLLKIHQFNVKVITRTIFMPLESSAEEFEYDDNIVLVEAPLASAIHFYQPPNLTPQKYSHPVNGDQVGYKLLQTCSLRRNRNITGRRNRKYKVDGGNQNKNVHPMAHRRRINGKHLTTL